MNLNQRIDPTVQRKAARQEAVAALISRYSKSKRDESALVSVMDGIGRALAIDAGAAGIGYFLRDNLTDPNFMPTLGQRDSEQRINELAAQLIEKHP